MDKYRIEVKEGIFGPVLATMETLGSKIGLTTPGITFPQFRSILIEALYNLDDCIQDEEGSNNLEPKQALNQFDSPAKD